MIAVHVRYYRQVLDRFMANGTHYVTIIREPSSQWESAFNHFGFKGAIYKLAGKSGTIKINSTHSTNFTAKTSSQDLIQEFLRKPETYHRILKTERFQGSSTLLWHYARNNQLCDMGLEPSTYANETFVNETIDRLEKEFSMVIINEFFDESLLVMKRMLCWSFKDILYLSKNQRPNRSNLTEETRNKIRKWNRADFLLYERFNRTLWKKIGEYGPTFSADLAEFRRLLNETHANCSEKSKVLPWGKNFKHVEFLPKANASIFCQTIAESKAALFKRVFNRQNPKKVSPKPRPRPRPRVRHPVHSVPKKSTANKIITRSSVPLTGRKSTKTLGTGSTSPSLQNKTVDVHVDKNTLDEHVDKNRTIES